MSYNWIDQHKGMTVPESGSASEAHLVNQNKHIKGKLCKFICLSVVLFAPDTSQLDN
jgi:hypothetical protein